jgi:hypothetical protein
VKAAFETATEPLAVTFALTPTFTVPHLAPHVPKRTSNWKVALAPAGNVDADAVIEHAPKLRRMGQLLEMVNMVPPVCRRLTLLAQMRGGMLSITLVAATVPVFCSTIE